MQRTKRVVLGVIMALTVQAGFSAPLPAPGAKAKDPNAVWTTLAVSNIETKTLTPRGQNVLSDPEFKWKHAQTDKFQIHYDSGMFAQKVARMAEFFYGYIAADMTGSVDLARGQKSHIFVFKDEKAWGAFQTRHAQDVGNWMFSMVEGTCMYLQQAEQGSSSADVLGHEMTHLIMNRFLKENIPLWLNEGLAEWYGEFAYSAFKGIKKSKRQQFKNFAGSIPPALLFSATDYPGGVGSIQLFYASARQVVGFLQLEYPPQKIYPFVLDMSKGLDAAEALKKNYGFASMDAFTTAFTKFCK